MMKSFILLSLMLNFILFFRFTTAQDQTESSPSFPSNTPAATTTSPPSVSLTPEMSASSVSSYFSSLATTAPEQPGNGESLVWCYGTWKKY